MGAIAGLLAEKPNALGAGLGATLLTRANSAPQTNPFAPSGLLGQAVPKAATRKTFFSFHYQRDIWRATNVRNSHVIRGADLASEFIDNSLWEKAKKTDSASLKRMINAGMENTSVTCVLAGGETWSRPWVRYEIANSVRKGNGLLTVYVDGITCPNTGPCWRGPNPLDFMGVYKARDGKVYVAERVDGLWRQFKEVNEPVSWPKFLPAIADGYVQPLSAGALAHDYGADGPKKLPDWIQTAAVAAGR